MRQNMQLKCAIKTLRVQLYVLLLLIFCGGCGGIKIIDSETGRHRLIPCADWREVVAGIDDKEGVFYTLMGEGDSIAGRREYLLRKKVDFDGNIIDVKKVPMIPKLHYSDPSYARLSPDGDRLVCYDTESGWLSCLDFETGGGKVLTNRFKSSNYSILNMLFINQNEVMLFVNEFESDSVLGNPVDRDRTWQAKIFMVDINTGKENEWYVPISLSGSSSCCASGRVAFFEGYTKHSMSGRINVFDIESKETIGCVNLCAIPTAFEFNGDGSKLVYFSAHEINIFDLATGTSRGIGRVRDDSYVVFIGFLDQKRIIYHLNREAQSGVFIRDIETGAILKEIKTDVFDCLFAADGGKKIIVTDY